MGERYERREVRDGVFEDFLLKSKIRERTTTGAHSTLIIIITITSVAFFILLLRVITIITITIKLLLDTLLALLL